MYRPSRVQGRVSPIAGACRRPDCLIQPAKQTRDVSRKSSSAISGFRSLCGHEQRSSFSRRTQRTSLWNLYPAGLSWSSRRTPASARTILTGPATLNRCCETERSRSARIIQAVFRVPLRLYRGKNRPVMTLSMPARSAFGRPAGAKPALTIKPSTSLLWLCPTSTTRAPPGTSKRVASGMIAR